MDAGAEETDAGTVNETKFGRFLRVPLFVDSEFSCKRVVSGLRAAGENVFFICRWMSVCATGPFASSKSSVPTSRSEPRSDVACFVISFGIGEPGVAGLPLCLDGDTGGVHIADSAVDDAAGTCTPTVVSVVCWLVDIGSSWVGSRCASRVEVLLVTSVIVIGARFGMCSAARDLRDNQLVVAHAFAYITARV